VSIESIPGSVSVRKRVLLVLAVILVAPPAALVAFDALAPHAAARAGAGLERWRAGLETKQLALGELQLAYLDGGAGEPLLLIHGFGADKDNFTRVAGHLTPRYRVLIPDLPGYGDSSKPGDGDYSVARQVENVRAFARTLGVQRAHVGGSSMGGQIAATWAAKYPAEVASLWLLAPAGTAAAADSELGRRYRDGGESLLVARTPEEHARVRDFVMSRPPYLPSSVRRVLGERAAANFELHSRIFAELARTAPLESWVSRIEAPALIVWGTEDRALHPNGAEAMRALLPGGRVVLMPGIGHLPMIEAVAATARDYLAFRQSLAPG
jgi:pimeloyl-ACP methyl ester carboxylesterase